METLPQANDSFGILWRMMVEPLRSKLLFTGIELKVFNHLSDPKSVDTLARAIGTHSKNTEVFLDALTAIDLLEKKNGLYKNSALAQSFLVEDTPTYLGGLLRLQQSMISVESLSQLIKEGPQPNQEIVSSEDTFAQEYANAERAHDAPMMAKIVSKLPEFSSFRKMLDLGGGPGLVGMTVVAAHPTMKGVIFDLPLMAKIAQTFIEKQGMEDRMTALGGDGFRDSIGEEYDLVIACSSLQAFKDRLDYVVKKVYDALNPGGVFISYFTGLTHERTKPETSVLTLLSMAFAGWDTGFDQGFVADSMLRTGFKSVRSQTLTTPWGPMELDIARK